MKGRDINGQKEREKTVMSGGEGSRSGTNSVCVIGLMIREREKQISETVTNGERSR